MANGLHGTYLGAIKPVGEKILLNFNLGDNDQGKIHWTANTIVYYDFVLSQNYVVTGMKISKTVALLSATPANTLTVSIVKIDADGTTRSTIAQCAFSGSTGVFGAKQIAGVAEAGATPVAIGTSAGQTNLFGGTEAKAADPLILVAANKKGIAGTGNSQQLLRLYISGVTATALNPDCLIEVQVAKYIELVQGDANSTVQIGELYTPANVAV